MNEYQTELFVEFDEIIKPKTSVCDLNIYNKIVTVRMDLNEKFIGIGRYLLEQCFCHTDSRPIIMFKYNDGYTGYAKYDIPVNEIRIDDEHVYFQVRFSKWLDISSAYFGGMYG